MKVCFTALIFILPTTALILSACSDDTLSDLRTRGSAGTHLEASGFDLTAIESYAPVLSTSAWPTIHQNDRGTKEGAGVGPTQPKEIEVANDAETILMTVGKNFLYHQAIIDTKLRMYPLGKLGAAPVREFDLGTFWPRGGGGNIDHKGNHWWTGNRGGPVLIRLNEDMTQSVISDDLNAALPQGTEDVGKNFNSVNFLSDGTVLVSTMEQWMYFVSPVANNGGKFPVRGVFSKLWFTSKGKQVIQPTESYGPRPIMDGDGSFYFVSSNTLVRVEYDPAAGEFKREATWVFKNPQNARRENSNMGASNPVVIGPYVCTVTLPGNSLTYQMVYCLDRKTGALKHSLQPFQKPGIGSAHTTGGIDGTQELFVIASDNGNGGGVAAFSLKTGSRLWPNVALPKVSQGFVLASKNRRLYITSAPRFGRIDFNAIDIDSGKNAVIHTMNSAISPLSSLGALDERGNLYYPHPGGFSRLRD